MKNLTAQFVWMALLASCAHRGLVEDSSREVASEPDSYPILNDRNYYDLIANFESPYVKFLILTEGERLGEIHFISKELKFHADLATRLPEFRGLSNEQIDQLSMHNAGRRLLFGVLTFPRIQNHGDQIKASFELVSSDVLSPSLVAQTYRLLEERAPYAQALVYHPTVEQRAAVVSRADEFKNLGVPLELESSSAITTCYTEGWAVGRVRVAKADDLPQLMQNDLVGPEDILVLDRAPRELPLVAGVIVGAESSPSSHVALLTEMSGSPFAYEKDAPTLEKWKRLERSQEPVYLETRGSVGSWCRIQALAGKTLNSKEYSGLLRLKRPKPIVIRPYDSSPKHLLNLDTVSVEDAPIVGAKAANLAQLRRLIPQESVEKAWAIPLSYYARYLREGTRVDGQPLGELVARELSEIQKEGVTLSKTMQGLERIRRLISKGKMPADMEQSILTELAAAWPEGTRLKFRSSSNAEDSPAFNGAGLYESFGACLGDDVHGLTVSKCKNRSKPDPVLKTVRKVWSSLYTLKGFLARRRYGIDEKLVGMGVLIHDSFSGELANGVALSSEFSQWDQRRHVRIVSTGFPGEDDAVTNPPFGKVPETASFDDSEKLKLLVPTTELPTGRQVLNEQEYAHLYEIISKVHRDYQSRKSAAEAETLRLDFEWKLMASRGQRRLVLKQVRPVPGAASKGQLEGRGSFIIGGRSMKFCPQTDEDPDALKHLILGRALHMDVGLHELPISDKAGKLANPVEFLAVEGKQVDAPIPLQMSPKARFKIERPWFNTGDSHMEFRTVSMNVDYKTSDHSSRVLSWEVDQERDPQRPELLTRPTRPFEALYLSEADSNSENSRMLRFFRQDGKSPCTPNFMLKEEGDKAEILSVDEHFEGGNSGIKVRSEGRYLRLKNSAYQKTWFYEVTRLTVTGLLARPLVVTTPGRAVYAPAHHNFSWSLGADLFDSEGLTSSERSELERRGVRYLILSSGSTENTLRGYLNFQHSVELGTIGLGSRVRNAE